MEHDERPYNLNRPAHLVAAQVIRDLEALAMVKFGPVSTRCVVRLVEQYQDLLAKQEQEIAALELHNAKMTPKR